jgi:hypothetical protein
MSQQHHTYSMLEVLRRGVPLECERTTVPHIPCDDRVASYKRRYQAWLRSSSSLVEIEASYGKLFIEGEDLFGSDLDASMIARLNGPHFMVGMLSGDVEVGIMEQITSWSLPRSKRVSYQQNAQIRYSREQDRVRAMIKSNEKAQENPGYAQELELKETIHKDDTNVTAEGLRLASQFASLGVLGSFIEHKTEAPNRGIKNVGQKITDLASSSAVASSLYYDAENKDVKWHLSGAILEAEMITTIWRACALGLLDKAWPIAASQRLDYGHFRGKGNRQNTDIVCLFTGDDLAIPIQIHSVDEPLPGEAKELVVLHRKDLYVPTRRELRLGAITLGILGIKGGASQDYIDSRATFIASKINNLADRVVDLTVGHGILVR